MSALDPQQTALEHITETTKCLRSLLHEDLGRGVVGFTSLVSDKNFLVKCLEGNNVVTLARVLALNPKLIVADELTSGFDPIEETLF